jgi:hypothetical protein
MSARDELAQFFASADASAADNAQRVDALIAEGWRKMPSRDELVEALAKQDAYDWYVDHEAEPRIAGNAFLRGVDAILALIEGDK